MEHKLNKLLANFVIEYHKLQNYHWYIKGKDFFQVHAKLEDIYNGINGAIDELAEHILMIGYQPLASLKEFLENADIEEAKMENIKSKHIFKEILSDFSKLQNDVLEIKKMADEKENYLISSLMDDYIKEFSKNIWMIHQVINE